MSEPDESPEQPQDELGALRERLAGLERVEERCREVEERLQAFFEAAFEGIAIHVGGVILDANPSMAAMFGYGAGELVGKHALDLSAPASRDLVRERIATGDERPYEGFGLRKDGSTFPAELHGKNITYRGPPARVPAVRDLTARRRAEQSLLESEAKYRALVETTATGYLIINAEGRVLDANAEYVRMSGHHSLAEIFGRRVVEWTAGYDRSRNAEAVRRCLRESYVRNLEVDYVDRTGRVTPVEINATVIRTETGVRVLSLCRDISERRRAEAKLQEYARNLQTLSRQLLDVQEQERRHLARELHDEIGQILTAVNLALDLEAKLPEEERRANHGEARRLVRDLTSRVRDLSLRLRPTMLDDLGLRPALLWMFERYTAQTGVRVQLEQRGLNGRLPVEVETAAYRIVQEALTNVARHARAEVVTVRVWLDAGRLFLQVEDQGVGFRPEALAVGTSGGLSGMHERAALLGGRLTIESSPGGGTRVAAELPLPITPES